MNLLFTAVTYFISASHRAQLMFPSAVSVLYYHLVEKSEKRLTSMNSISTMLMHKEL
jgi:hypothetical protein